MGPKEKNRKPRTYDVKRLQRGFEEKSHIGRGLKKWFDPEKRRGCCENRQDLGAISRKRFVTATGRGKPCVRDGLTEKGAKKRLAPRAKASRPHQKCARTPHRTAARREHVDDDRGSVVTKQKKKKLRHVARLGWQEPTTLKASPF